jgi:hypothetical protein
MELTLQQAEKFVTKSPNAQWQGWDINIYQPEDNAMLVKNGAFWNGRWCLRFTVRPNYEGKYVISKRASISASRSWD